MNMYRTFSGLALVCSLMFGCGHKAEAPANEPLSIVVYDPKGGDDLFGSDMIRESEIIPLETSDSLLIGASPECIVDSDGNYYILDIAGSQKIFRYDARGNFVNSIGSRGKGPQEYLRVANCVVDTLSGDLVVFSDLNKKICRFGKDGGFRASQTAEIQFSQGIPTGKGDYWLYLGHANAVSDYSVLKIDAQGEIRQGMLPAKKNIMPVEERYPVFIQADGGRVLLRESLNNQISEITEEGVNPIYRFDFGRYNIPDEYFEKKDAMEAGQFLMQQEFVILDRVMENPNYTFVQAIIQRPAGVSTLVYGIQERRSGQWQWFNFDDVENNRQPGFNSVRYLTDRDELICLVDPGRLMQMSPEKRNLFKNPEAIDRLSEEGNPVIVKCHLK